MEWASYGDLVDCVQSPLPEVEAREIAKQISYAIVILHEHNFLHRDLSPKVRHSRIALAYLTNL